MILACKITDFQRKAGAKRKIVGMIDDKNKALIENCRRTLRRLAKTYGKRFEKALINSSAYCFTATAIKQRD